MIPTEDCQEPLRRMRHAWFASSDGASLEAFDAGVLSPIADLENAQRYRAAMGK